MMSIKKLVVGLTSGLVVVLSCFFFVTAINTDNFVEQVDNEKSSFASSQEQADESQSQVITTNTTQQPMSQAISIEEENVNIEEGVMAGEPGEEDVNLCDAPYEFTDEDARVYYKIEGGTLYIAGEEKVGYTNNIEAIQEREDRRKAGQDLSWIDPLAPGWFEKFLPVGKVVIEDSMQNVHPGLMKSWFSTLCLYGVMSRGLPHVNSFVGIQNLKFDQATDTSYMFAAVGHGYSCQTFTYNNTLNLPAIQNMTGMFCLSASNIFFDDATGLTVTTGNDATLIDAKAFLQDRKNVKSVDLNGAKLGALTATNSMFWNCEKLESITGLANQTCPIETSPSMFRNCTSLSELPIPSGIKSTGNNFALGDTGIKHANLPSTVQTIGDNAYAYCTKLKKFVCGTDNAPKLTKLGKKAFENCGVLETFVLRTSSDSGVTYENDAFTNAGTNNPEEAAPLVLAGGSTLSTIYSGSIPCYTYYPIQNPDSAQPANPPEKVNKRYYFLTNNYYEKGTLDFLDSNSTYVIDLNGFNLDRGFTSLQESGNNRVLRIGNEDSGSMPLNIHVRLDDTSFGGQGKLKGSSVASYEGGIRVCTGCKLDFVRGKVAQNYSKNCGGICLSSYTGSSVKYKDSNFGGYLNMYDGSEICDNTSTTTDSSKAGGGLRMLKGSVANIYGGKIHDNISSAPNGGGIKVSAVEDGLDKQSVESLKDYTHLYIYNGLVYNNTAQGKESNISVGDENSLKQKICVKKGHELIELDGLNTNEERGYFTFGHDYDPNTKKNSITINGFDGNICTTAYLPYKFTPTMIKDDQTIRWEITDNYYIGDGTNPIFSTTGCQCLLITLYTTVINDNAFANNDVLKKVVVEKRTKSDFSDLTFGNNIFDSCSSLENYVVKATNEGGGDKINYGNNIFLNAGTESDAHAPLVIASYKKVDAEETSTNQNTYDKAPQSKFFKYRERGNIKASEGRYFGKADSYYYLIEDIDMSERDESATVSAERGVVDLNNHKFDRGLKEKEAKLQGAAIIVRGSDIYSPKDVTFRIDNTADINTKMDSKGQITGGHAMTNPADASSNVRYHGGGISMPYYDDRSDISVKNTIERATLQIVNGNICDNLSEGEGGGVFATVHADKIHEGIEYYRKINMYGGVIANNTAQKSGGNQGGGLGLNSYCTFNMYDGYIIGNKALGNGYGAAMKGSGSIFNIYGGRIGGLSLDSDECNYALTGGACVKNDSGPINFFTNKPYAKYNTIKDGKGVKLGGYRLGGSATIHFDNELAIDRRPIAE